MTNNPRLVRPRKVNCAVVVEAVEENQSMNTRMLAEDFDYSHIEIKNIVYKADKNQFSSFHLHFSRQMTEEIAS